MLLGLASGPVASCRSGTSTVVSEAPAPGYTGEEAKPDDAPFEMAEASNRGSTTIPESFFGNATTTSTTTTAPPTTTTTQPPYELPSTVTSICGVSRSIRSLFPQTEPSDALVRRTLDGLLRNLDAYLRLAPDEIEADLSAIRDMVQELDRLFTEGGDTVRYPPLVSVIMAIRNGSAPYQDLAAQLDHVTVVEQSVCSASQ